ncbi:MAG: cell division protein FtsL [Polyangiales bacterium]
MGATVKDTRRFVSLWLLAVFAAALAFIAHLSLRFQNIEFGYQISEARKVQHQLVQDKQMLALEAATLRQADRVEEVARRSLRMTSAQSSQVVHVRLETREVEVAGVMR